MTYQDDETPVPEPRMEDWHTQMAEAIVANDNDNEKVPATQRAVSRTLYSLMRIRVGDVDEGVLYLNKAKTVLADGGREIDQTLAKTIKELLRVVDENLRIRDGKAGVGPEVNDKLLDVLNRVQRNKEVNKKLTLIAV